MKSRPFFLLILLLGLVLSGCQSESKPTIPKPDIELGMFANQAIYRLALSEDQEWLLFDLKDTSSETSSILFSVFQGDGWSKPQLVPFSGTYNDMDPFIAPDQQTIFFMSTRPLFKGDSISDWNIWQVKRLGQGFDDPIPLPANINTELSEVFPTVDKDGNLYFAMRSPNGLGGNDLWMAESTRDGLWKDPMLLPAPINTPQSDANPTINPKGDSLVYFSMRNGNVDLYLTCRERKKWTEPKAFNQLVNTSSIEGSAFIRNGKLYFFRANPTGQSNLLEISLKRILDK